jgi:DNA-binding beta-propeller fold protein YncE
MTGRGPRSGLFLAALGAGLAAVLAALPAASNSAALAGGDWRVVVVNDLSTSDSISVTSTAAPGSLSTLAVGSVPLDTVITPNGKLALVANVDSDNVSPVDLAANPPKVLSPLAVSGVGFTAISPDGATAYVPDPNGDTVTPVDLSANPPRLEKPFQAGATPVSVAITPNGQTAWVANNSLGIIRAVSLTDGHDTLGRSIAVGPQPL